MYSTELKIKRLSLAAEARIIRAEEKRMKARRRADTLKLNSLHFHRKGVVRPAARAAHLAHAYLRGMPYAKVEDPARTRSRPTIDWMNLPSICANLKTFGGRQFSQMEKKALFTAVSDWLDGGAPVSAEASNPQAAGSTPAAASSP